MRLNVKTKNATTLSLFNKNVYKSLVTRDVLKEKHICYGQNHGLYFRKDMDTAM